MFIDVRSMGPAGCRDCCWKYSGRGPGAAMTNTAKTVVACGKVRFHHSRRAISQSHIDSADDSCCRPQVTVAAAGAFGSDTLNKLGLTDDAEFFRAIRAIHGPTLDEYGLPYVMALHVCRKVFEEIDLGFAFRRIPEVVMRIDDRELRLERFFFSAGEPFVEL